MPYHQAIIGELELVEIDREGPIPAFVGQIDGHKLLIRFDVAALAQIAGRVGSGKAIARSLQARAPVIKAAAQTLLKGGFWTETDDGLEILVTALDL